MKKNGTFNLILFFNTFYKWIFVTPKKLSMKNHHIFAYKINTTHLIAFLFNFINNLILIHYMYILLNDTFSSNPHSFYIFYHVTFNKTQRNMCKKKNQPAGYRYKSITSLPFQKDHFSK